MTGTSTGLARTELPRAELVKLDGREGSFQMVRRSIDVPQDLIYKIGGGRGGYLASAFDLFARELGISFDVVSAEPIYEKGNLRAARVRVRAEYFNASGKLVADEAECYIDVDLLYQESRAKWERKLYSCKTMEDAKKQSKNPDFIMSYEVRSGEKTYTNFAERAKKAVVRDADGNPSIKYLLPDDAECELWENFMTLRKNALQKAQTVARRTLVQRAIAVKSFDANNPNAGKKMAIYGFVQVAGMEADNVFAEELHEAAPANMNPAVEESSQPHEPEGAVSKPVKAASSPSPDEPGETQGGLICELCNRPLTEKDAQWFKKRGGQFCFNCWKKSKEE